MRRDFPGEAHAAVHLDAGAAVRHGSLVGEELGPGRSYLGIADVRLVDSDSRGLDSAAGHLGPHDHVCAQVLHGLKPADGPAELDAPLGVFDGEITGPLRQADLQGCGQHGTVATPPCGDIGPGYRLTGREYRQGPDGGERIHRSRQWRGIQRARIEALDAGFRQHKEDVEIGQVFDDHRQRGAPHGPRNRALDKTDDHGAVVGTVDEPGGQVACHKRAGDECVSERLEHERRFGQTQTDPAGCFGQAQAEHAGLTELAPSVAVDYPVGRLGGPDRLQGEDALAQPPDAVGQLSLELGDLEVHRRPYSFAWAGAAALAAAVAWGSLGSPRIRSPTMFRWICEVPAAMVREIPRSQSSTMTPAGSRPSPSIPSLS